MSVLEQTAAIETGPVLLELGVVLIALAVLAGLGARTGLSTIPFYLLGGLALGALDPLEFSAEFVETGAAIGVVLLLFMLGVEYSGEELVENLRSGLPVGALDLVLNFLPGVVAGLALEWSLTAAFLLGGVTYISSSGVIAKVLNDLGRLGNRETPIVLSILVMEDLAMAVYLPIAAVLAVGGSALQASGSLALAVGAAAVALIVALRYGERLSALLAGRSDEAMLLTVLGVVLVVAGAAEAAQVSAGVGAFLVGIAFSGPMAERARLQVGPLRDLFAATFFLFFGLQIDAGELPGVLVPALILAVVSGVTKLATGWWAARRQGVGAPGRARAATVLIARGEFSIVIAGIGVAAGIEAALGPLAAAYVLTAALGGAIVTRFAGAPRIPTEESPELVPQRAR